jgi:hypothetical protein
MNLEQKYGDDIRNAEAKIRVFDSAAPCKAPEKLLRLTMESSELASLAIVLAT